MRVYQAYLLLFFAGLFGSCVPLARGDYDDLYRYAYADAEVVRPLMHQIGVCKWRDVLVNAQAFDALGYENPIWAFKMTVWCGPIQFPPRGTPI